MLTDEDKKGRSVAGDARPKSPLRDLSDENLMTHFQQGVVEAFDILVDRYSTRLFHFVNKFVKDAHTAEDVVQDSFIRVYRNRHSYKPIAKFSTWLYTIAGNLARSEYRKEKRRKTTPLYSTGPGKEEFELPISADVVDPNRAAESRIHAEQILKALREIPDPFREVVTLRDVQQLSYEEIAEITGLPLGTVKSRIHRGRSQLQEKLRHLYNSG